MWKIVWRFSFVLVPPPGFLLGIRQRQFDAGLMSAYDRLNKTCRAIDTHQA
jgi:hypothetical protein